MFEAIHNSTLLSPGLLLFCTLGFLAWLMSRQPPLVAFLALFGVSLCGDLLLTGVWSPLKSAAALQYASILFVVLGDWRYFVLLDATLFPRWSHRLRLATSLGCALLIPIATQVARALSTSIAVNLRVTFLVYELLFLLLAVGIRAALFRTPKAPVDPTMHRWATSLTNFEIAQYGLWATADVVILAGQDWGFGLRILPNVMYYALFLPFVWWTAPPAARALGYATAPQTLGTSVKALTVVGLFALLAPIAPLGCTKAESSSPASNAPPEAAAASHVADATLSFFNDGNLVRTLSRTELEHAITVEQWSAFDPYYEQSHTYKALLLQRVLELGFGQDAATLAREEFVLHARDGFTVAMLGNKAFEAGAYIAVDDVNVPGFEPIGPRKQNPGPFYLVWRGPEQQKLDRYPRPWQLAKIEIARFDARYPHTIPQGASTGSLAYQGFSIFRQQCLECHAMNREGGRIGPDLNVPQSIVEYRPTEQIRAYIRNPLAFRYGTMPAHPGLSDQNLDALLAYFETMKTQKHDADATQGAKP